MAHWRSVGLPLACVLVVAGTATAQESAGEKRYELNLDDTLALARERAPAIQASEVRIGLARGHLEDASVLLPRNPSLEVGGGPRIGPDGTSVDLEAGVGFAFELGGQREARIEAATGAIEQAQATALDTRRRLLRATAVAFLRTRHAAERLRVADEVAALADEIHRFAKRRHEAGYVGVLDVKLAALPLFELLAMRRELIASRTAHLDLLLQAALTGVELEAETGVLQREDGDAGTPRDWRVSWASFPWDGTISR